MLSRGYGFSFTFSPFTRLFSSKELPGIIKEKNRNILISNPSVDCFFLALREIIGASKRLIKKKTSL